MSEKNVNELFSSNVLAIIKETFEKVDGIYLDRNTSLLETLNAISAEAASRPVSESGTSIAAHLYHARFYIQVLRDYMDGKWNEGVDWKGSWSHVNVSDNEWESLRKELAEDYRDLLAYLQGIKDWSDERRLGGAIAIVAHTAYHLGAIRQMMRIKGE